MEIIYRQDGGSVMEYAYDCENEEDIDDKTPVVPCRHNTRSCVIGKISKDYYDNIDIPDLGREGIKVRVYKPGEEMVFDNELITTDDYSYPDRSLCVSSCFTDDIISDYYTETDGYRLVAVDMIWCRENHLLNTLPQ